ncbi:phage tail tape measure protein [Mycoplana ramosa]|uniref:Phage tail tape measure protein n=1 Tax=Mycoplana ramosa TaxID=40837 RepID=A0ABW3YWK1_MYCRA
MREVEARLKISAVDRTGKVFQSLAGRLQQVNRQAASLNRQQSMVGRGAASMAAAIGRYAAPAVLAYGAKQAITDFASVERQMTRIGITADASADETEAAFTRMQDVSKDLALPVQSAIDAVDTLVSSGLSLREAMDFLPSVLATAQASGSATQDIANTAIKAASALKIETSQMQQAFDVMVTGGKAGQFELKDMATYIPELANSFASLGYEGEDGLKKLIAILQTLREDTGSASGAATQAQNVFDKMFTADTSKKFAEFGINLRREMEAARKNGEDAVAAFVRLSKEAIKGDLSKLPLLFTDQEFRLGMQSLMTSADSYKRFIDAVNSSEVEGTVLRDLQRVTGDTQASIDRLGNSWDKLKNSIGRGVAGMGGVTAMDAVSNTVDYHTAVNVGLEKRGLKGWWERTAWGVTSSQADKDQAAIEGGYSDPEFVRRHRAQQYIDGKNKTSTGRQGSRVVIPEFPGSSGMGTPVPFSRPNDDFPSMPQRLDGLPVGLRPAPAVASMGQVTGDLFRTPSKAEWQEALKIDATGLKQSGAEAAQKVAESGREAGQAIEDSAAFFKVAGVDVGAAIMAAAEKLHQAANRFNNAQITVANAAVTGKPKVNADTGRSMPEVSGATGGGGGY